MIAASNATRPTANVRLPGQSTFACRCRVPTSCRLRYAQTVPSTPNGTLTQNTSRQSTSDSTPPTTSPANDPPIPATMLMPTASPRRVAGNTSVMIAVEFAMSIAPPTPCTTRSTISHIAPLPPANGSSASPTEAMLKTAKPAL